MEKIYTRTVLKKSDIIQKDTTSQERVNTAWIDTRDQRVLSAQLQTRLLDTAAGSDMDDVKVAKLLGFIISIDKNIRDNEAHNVKHCQTAVATDHPAGTIILTPEKIAQLRASLSGKLSAALKTLPRISKAEDEKLTDG